MAEEPTVALSYMVSIDVGIKNLAICVFKYPEGSIHYSIKDWVVLNIGCLDVDYDVDHPPPNVKCSMCTKPAKYRRSTCPDGEVFCNKHAKDHTVYILPKGELGLQKIKKYKLTDLKRVLTPFVSTTTPMPKTKANWTDLYDTLVLCPIGEPGMAKTTAYTEISLIEVARILTQKLTILFSEYEGRIAKVLIENQISPIATRMKSVQSMVTQYFVMKCPSADIQYVSSTHKLDGLSSETYSERKKLGIQKCKEHLATAPEWLNYMVRHKKQDDLSDCYLQGLWYINTQSKCS
jgi:hypothetical protein